MYQKSSFVLGAYLLFTSLRSGDLILWDSTAGFIRKWYEYQGGLVVRIQKLDLVPWRNLYFFSEHCMSLLNQRFDPVPTPFVAGFEPFLGNQVAKIG